MAPATPGLPARRRAGDVRGARGGQQAAPARARVDGATRRRLREGTRRRVRPIVHRRTRRVRRPRRVAAPVPGRFRVRARGFHRGCRGRLAARSQRTKRVARVLRRGGCVYRGGCVRRRVRRRAGGGGTIRDVAGDLERSSMAAAAAERRPRGRAREANVGARRAAPADVLARPRAGARESDREARPSRDAAKDGWTQREGDAGESGKPI
mmetsp:Transcript_14607/g.57437  ORF Transcript_14607/g.57437 Transcript_14607/m.57437 type:complete len:210 (+) Transcript_14607:468-1097(+)